MKGDYAFIQWLDDVSKAFSYRQVSIDINDFDKEQVDLAKFQKLESLTCYYNQIKNLESQIRLKSLTVHKYQNESRIISLFKELEFLSLIQGRFIKLDKIQSENLSKIELYFNSKLDDISGILNHPNIKELDIESCKKIPVDHLIEVVTSCAKLEVLKLSHFEFPNLEWVRGMKCLKQLVIIDCNVLNGDISPAIHLEYVAIDNRKHYNYRFDNVTRTIHPVIPKGAFVPKGQSQKDGKIKGSVVELPHFRELDIKVLDMDYETDMPFNAYRVDLELHFEEESITKSKLSQAIKLLQNVEKDNDVILDLFKKDFGQGGVVKEYFDYFTDEVDEAKEDDFWQTLLLKRIAFYPHDDESYGVYDYGIDEISPYVLSLKVNAKGKITGCEMES